MVDEISTRLNVKTYIGLNGYLFEVPLSIDFFAISEDGATAEIKEFRFYYPTCIFSNIDPNLMEQKAKAILDVKFHKAATEALKQYMTEAEGLYIVSKN
ncbi:MAG: hypothetical protein V1900_00345 [Candidatus Aenigmatarchaeota archaeon]